MNSQDIKIIPLANNPGLIVEEIASMTTSSTYYKIIHEIDLLPFIQRGFMLEENISKLNQICNNNCSENKPIKNLIDKLIKNKKNLENILGWNLTTGKIKRFSGLSSFIMNRIWRIIYKTFTDFERKEIITTLELNKNTTNILGKLLSVQSEVILTQFENDHNRTEQMHNFLQKFKDQYNNMTRRKEITEAYHFISENYLQFELDTNKLLNAILFASLGILHPLLFHEDIITTVKNSVNTKIFNAKFPLNEEKISKQELLQISAIDVFIVDYNLISTIEIPLIDNTQYILYKLYALPKTENWNPKETILSFILPEKDYVAPTQDKNYFTMLSQNMIQDCKKIRNTYICPNHPPVQETKYTDKCEPKIAANLPLKIDECNIKLFKSSTTYWIKLTNNSWAYSAPKPETLVFKCQKNPIAVKTIEKCGIIQLEPDCVVNSKTIQFTSNRHYSKHAQFKNYTAP